MMVIVFCPVCEKAITSAPSHTDLANGVTVMLHAMCYRDIREGYGETDLSEGHTNDVRFGGTLDETGER